MASPTDGQILYERPAYISPAIWEEVVQRDRQLDTLLYLSDEQLFNTWVPAQINKFFYSLRWCVRNGKDLSLKQRRAIARAIVNGECE